MTGPVDSSDGVVNVEDDDHIMVAETDSKDLVLEERNHLRF